MENFVVKREDLFLDFHLVHPSRTLGKLYFSLQLCVDAYTVFGFKICFLVTNNNNKCPEHLACIIPFN